MKKSILILFTFIYGVMLANKQTIDFTTPSTVDFSCGQSDSLLMQLDDSWQILNLVTIKHKGTNISMSESYYLKSNLSMPLDGNLFVSVQHFYISHMYGMYTLIVLMIITITMFIERKKIESKRIFRSVYSVIMPTSIFLGLNLIFLFTNFFNSIDSSKAVLLISSTMGVFLVFRLWFLILRKIIRSTYSGNLTVIS